MRITTVFASNRAQAVRQLTDVRLPNGAKKVQVRRIDRIISPAGHIWDAFFHEWAAGIRRLRGRPGTAVARRA